MSEFIVVVVYSNIDDEVYFAKARDGAEAIAVVMNNLGTRKDVVRVTVNSIN